MQRKFGMLLVLMLALSLVFCFGVLAWAADEPTAEAPAEEPNAAVPAEEPVAEAPAEEPAAEEAFVIPVPQKVVVSTQALSVDGELVEAEAYNVDGSNYFKLRDLAALLADTGSKFNVTYEAPNMIVTTGEAYTALDSDLVKGEDKSATCVPSQQVLLVNGEKVDILVYNIGGNNFFQLRALESLLGITVSYDEATRTMVVVSADAADEEAPADEATPAEGEEAPAEGEEATV